MRWERVSNREEQGVLRSRDAYKSVRVCGNKEMWFESIVLRKAYSNWTASARG